MTLKGYTETEKKWIYSKSIIDTDKKESPHNADSLFVCTVIGCYILR